MTETQTETRTTTGPTAPPAPGTWMVDPAHSSIQAVARHMMVSRVRGRFESFTGEVRVSDDPVDSTVRVEIEASSINTNEEKRDAHLRSPDFLDADNHPHLVFESTRLTHVDGDRYELDGDLTIRGETHPVTLEVTYFGVNTDPWGGHRALFRATAQLDRETWKMTWNQALETGGVLVGKKLDIELDVQLVQA
jgi:polyisoprenoid-binding protein YceI